MRERDGARASVPPGGHVAPARGADHVSPATDSQSNAGVRARSAGPQSASLSRALVAGEHSPRTESRKLARIIPGINLASNAGYDGTECVNYARYERPEQCDVLCPCVSLV